MKNHLTVREQALRFVRLFAVTLLTQGLALQGGHLDRSAVVAAVVASIEVAYRHLKPVLPVKIARGSSTYTVVE